jgi:hypothetical protein
MNTHRTPGTRIPDMKTFALVAATVLVLGAIVAMGARELALESGQAASMVGIGKTALAAGDRASAILSFERASLLAPRADLVRSALAAAGVRAPAPPVARAVDWITPREWSSLALVFGWTAGLSVAVAIARRRSGLLAKGLALGSGVAFVLSIGGVVESNLASRARAVVMVPAGALVAPYEASGATADLQGGTVVAVVGRYGDFVEVRGPDGVRGWVTSGVLQPVVGAGT